LTNILKKEWEFDGFISTDWMYGIYDGIEAINAGLNVEMPWQDEYSYGTIKDGLKEDKIKVKDEKIKTLTKQIKKRRRVVVDSDLEEFML